ncbi:acetyl/propionyl/methylcrotonyl-CoA carboxylase subunit alpha [Candidatus Marimicrobium litorale]|uniref:Acetyl/propionyl/methylcrotonyl-CoA carboxylase subunit alpha n=1 Tax=Candidatus Marimicrobium litorale TaxID=2518991 RepID=A0ABT3T9S1_9GAMM|nr:acetyl/propionyl/methylcrotonyl-CoA carboxylase subunit alpha [Candidatus Marimicrobium litorale]MCX2979043.1 acetyl/propionyl/methylcrotonyl-CoA carboxylase subunit alpha [Candidatus Marimicrobium litorale]
MFKKILIANRGEIACRVIRTARRIGIATVAVYSDADSDALHVELADEAIHIGPAPAQDSYLQGERIIEAACNSGAEAIHPGYGFLSENAGFAAACEEQGIVFIGPHSSAIASMGSKSAAKRIMEEAGVPLIPGYHGDDQAPSHLCEEAGRIGYPVLLKATAGGGGKGMRTVATAAEFDEALAAAKREAQAAFGDDRMLVEKFLAGPRHVEIQVFFDQAGHGVYLAERDCSLQRRHQKVIEEAPAPGLTEDLRKAMGEAAVRAGSAIDYRGAGTVEFLLDNQNRFFFMEMNTRLQVEHPVTEMITGLDLVEWQLRVAAGQDLPLSQQAIAVRGHAFEARIYAEDPERDFLPATGVLQTLRAPAESAVVRVDTGVREGDEISVYYDPLIAKLVVWGETRAEALHRLGRVLPQYRIEGTVCNLPLLYNLATCSAFLAGPTHTRFIEEEHELVFRTGAADKASQLHPAALALLLHKSRHQTTSSSDPYSPWQERNAWRMNLPAAHRLELKWNEQCYPADIEQSGDHYRVTVAGDTVMMSATLEEETLHITSAGHRVRGTLAHADGVYTLYLAGGACRFTEVLADTGEQQRAEDTGLTAPMNGRVVTLLAAAGDTVTEGMPLLVMEAMKMEHTIRAPAAGVVERFHYAAGDLVAGGAMLLEFSAQAE